MALEFKYVRRSAKDVEERANRKGGGFEGFVKDDYKTFQPKIGDNAIRILPPASEGGNFTLDVYVHYNVGPERASVICLARMKGGKCPVCEERLRMERRGVDKEELRQLAPSNRVVMFVVNRKDEDQGVLVWPAPWTLERDINKVAKDKATGETYFFEDPYQGNDIYFEGIKDSDFTKYVGVQLAHRPTSAPDWALEFLLKNSLEDALVWRDYDEVMKLFTGGEGAVPEPAASTSAPTPRAAIVRPETAAPPAEQKQAVEEAEKVIETKAPTPAAPPAAESGGQSRAAALRAAIEARKSASASHA